MNTTFDIDAVILAGGQSRRMGCNKALLPFEGKPLIAHIVDRVQPVVRDLRISTNDADAFAFLGLPLVPDLLPDQGPLMGIASGLRASEREWTLMVATDMPDPPLNQLPAMLDLTATSPCVVLRATGGRIQPLFGLYHRSLADKILSLLASGERRVLTFINACGAAELALDQVSVSNLNDRRAYEAALDRASGDLKFRQ